MIKLQIKHLRNTSVSVEEQQLQAEIEKLNHDLKGPSQKVSQLKMQCSIMKTQMMPSGGIKQKYEVVDEREMDALVKVSVVKGISGVKWLSSPNSWRCMLEKCYKG